LLTSVYGMNVPLPQFPGSEHAQFWWLFAIMLVTAVVMLAMFRRKRWI
jgi:Mg2+ and Co2+ transporter CorA